MVGLVVYSHILGNSSEQRVLLHLHQCSLVVIADDGTP